MVLIQKYGIKIPYWRGGKTSSTGAYGGWGKYYKNPTFDGYDYYGMDCDGLVNWSFHNTGIVYNSILSNSYYNWVNDGLKIKKENGDIGDVLRKDGHVSIIIGKADNGFIVAEAYGESVGIVINVLPYTDSRYIIIKGEKLINTYEKKSKNDYPSGF